MKKVIVVVGISLLLMAAPTYSQSNSSENDASDTQKVSDEKEKMDLYSCWSISKKDNPARAFQIASKYIEKFRNDTSEKAMSLKQWLEVHKETAKSEDSEEDKDKISLESDGLKCPGLESKSDEIINVAGIWTIVVTTKQGDLQFTLTLEQDGQELGGSVRSANGDGEITNGKIEGNIIELAVWADPFDVRLTGTVTNDKMKGFATTNIPNVPELIFVGTRKK